MGVQLKTASRIGVIQIVSINGEHLLVYCQCHRGEGSGMDASDPRFDTRLVLLTNRIAVCRFSIQHVLNDGSHLLEIFHVC